MSEENKIAQIFEKHYGREDALEIERCIRGIILRGEQPFEERLITTLVKNEWSSEDAQSFVDALKGFE